MYEREPAQPEVAAARTTRAGPGVAVPVQSAGPSAVLALQRLAGNRAVAAHLTVQRQPVVAPPANETPAQKAKRTRDVGDARDASEQLAGATEDDKFVLVEILLSQGWVGPRDESALERIWGSFGEGLIDVASRRIETWKACIKRGAELDDMPVIARLKTAFEAETKARALANLRANDRYVRDELDRLGLSTVADVPAERFLPPSDEELRQLTEIRSLAQAAVSIISMMTWQRQEISFGGERFDPNRRPVLDLDLGLGDGRTIYDLSMERWDQSVALLAMIANSSPELFMAIGGATTAEERTGVPANLQLLADTDPAKNPQAAKRNIRTLLVTVLRNVETAIDNINSSSTDHRDLLAVHDQLRSGKAGGTTDWRKALCQWVIDDEVADHRSAEMWKELGLTAAGFVALVVAELATFGGATFLLATGVGVAAATAQAVGAGKEGAAMRAAGGSQVQSSALLVYQGQITAAEARAEAATINLALTGLLAGPGMALRMGEAAVNAQNAARLAVIRQRYAQKIAESAELERQIAGLERLLNTPGGTPQVSKQMQALEQTLGVPAAEVTAALPPAEQLTGSGGWAWELGAGARGMTIEGAVAKLYRTIGGFRRMPKNFKGLDFVQGGTVTVRRATSGAWEGETISGAVGISEKSLDLLDLAGQAKSAEAITATLQKHVRDLYQFEHYELAGITVENLSGRSLNVYIGRAPTAAQQAAIDGIHEYAAARDVAVKIIRF